MIDALLIVLILAAFVLIPFGVGYATRRTGWALGSAVAITVPAALLQAVDTNLPGFAVPILVLGAIGAVIGATAARRRRVNGAPASDEER